MRSFWLQVTLFFVYLLLVFFVSRIIDLVLWYHQGMPSTQIVDPFFLSVRQLKQLLESRGVSYTGYVEKKELVLLAKDSAHTMQGEVDDLNQGHNSHRSINSRKDRLPVPPTPSHFTGGGHFYEEVEDTKDSVWLVQVVPARSQHSGPLLDDYNWRLVCNHVAPFAIRTGIFDCALDRRLCSTKGWRDPLLLLALPKGSRAKDKVVLKTFTATRPQSIIEWVHDQLSVRINSIDSIEEVEDQWLGVNKTHPNPAASKHEVKVLLLTHLLQPPLFLAALSIKFTGRVKFGIFSVKRNDPETAKKLKQMDVEVPSYVVITPEKKVIYGRRKFEHFNFNSMNRFLRAVQPEMNDVFLFSLSFVNILVILQVFQVSGHMRWKKIAQLVWCLVSYNFWLFVSWLVILAIYRFPVVSFITDQCLVLTRIVSLSDTGSLALNDWQYLQNHPVVFCLTLFLFGFASRFLSWFQPEELDSSRESNRPWWEVLPVDSFWINCFFRPMATLSRPLPPSELELEEGIEMLIERLAVPNLWLQPVIPNEYIKDLPVWRFHGWDEDSRNVRKNIDSDSPEAIQNLMDCVEPPVGHNRTQSHFCSNCLKEKIRKIGFSCNQTFPSRTSCDERRDRECDSSPCLNAPVDMVDRQQRMKGSNSAHSSPPRVHSLCTCDIGIPPGTNQNRSGNRENHKQGERQINSSGASEDSSDEGSTAPSGMLPVSECAVCLEAYSWNSLLCGLPCGHNYHQSCIMQWLQRDNHHCPSCRWPAYKMKMNSMHLHQE